MSEKSFRDELALEAFKAQVNAPDFLMRMAQHEIGRAADSVARVSYRFADAMLEAKTDSNDSPTRIEGGESPRGIFTPVGEFK